MPKEELSNIDKKLVNKLSSAITCYNVLSDPYKTLTDSFLSSTNATLFASNTKNSSDAKIEASLIKSLEHGNFNYAAQKTLSNAIDWIDDGVKDWLLIQSGAGVFAPTTKTLINSAEKYLLGDTIANTLKSQILDIKAINKNAVQIFEQKHRHLENILNNNIKKNLTEITRVTLLIEKKCENLNKNNIQGTNSLSGQLKHDLHVLKKNIAELEELNQSISTGNIHLKRAGLKPIEIDKSLNTYISSAKAFLQQSTLKQQELQGKINTKIKSTKPRNKM